MVIHDVIKVVESIFGRSTYMSKKLKTDSNNQNEIEKLFPSHSLIFSNHLASVVHRIRLETIAQFVKIKEISSVSFSLNQFLK